MKVSAEVLAARLEYQCTRREVQTRIVVQTMIRLDAAVNISLSHYTLGAGLACFACSVHANV